MTTSELVREQAQETKRDRIAQLLDIPLEVVQQTARQS